MLRVAETPVSPVYPGTPDKAAFKLSVAVTVKVEVPVAEGVPDITPPELRVSPVGRLPEVRAQLTIGGLLVVAARVVL
jgi:hypothetical protein